MFFAIMDTGGITRSGHDFFSAGETEAGARMALAVGFVQWTGNNDSDDMVGDDPYGDWDETNVLEMLARRFDVDAETLTMETLPAAMNDYYRVNVVELQPGQCVIE